MSETAHKIIDDILESYNEHDITVHVEAENIVNKEIVIKIVEELRKILFPGFFDTNRVRNEYLRYLVGQRIEFVQYHLK